MKFDSSSPISGEKKERGKNEETQRNRKQGILNDHRRVKICKRRQNKR